MRDEDLLVLYERLPLGAKPSDIKGVFPSVSAQQSEGTYDESLTEMRMRATVMATSVAVEFNFKSDSLYAVSFNPARLPASAGDALFDSLLSFYSMRLGEAQVDDEQDTPYFVKSRVWAGPGCEVGVVNSIDGGMRQVGWGYQVPINLRASRKE